MQIKLVSLKFYNLFEIENFKQKYVCLSWFFFFFLLKNIYRFVYFGFIVENRGKEKFYLKKSLFLLICPMCGQ